jgi:hypothetical protein
MPHERDLFPPVREIADRLTVVAREHRRLKTLLKLASQAEDDRTKRGRLAPDPSSDDRKAVSP